MRFVVVLVVGLGLLVATPAAADSGCANGQPDAEPVGNGEKVIVDYFRAVNARDYTTA
jgi:hypothetical protein